MGLFNYKSLFSWITNPIGNLIDLVNDSVGKSESETNHEPLISSSEVNDAVSKVWNDLTGQTAIEKEFELNKDLARYQTDMQEEIYNKYSSPEALMSQYSAAGLNPNLIYGSSSSGQGNVPSYSSPAAAHQMSYLDKVNKALGIISSVQGVKNLIYQTVANREAAEQAAIRTANNFNLLRQNRIKTEVLANQVGYTGGGISPFFRNSSLSRVNHSVSLTDPLPGLTEYSNALRSEVLNRAYSAYSNNYWLNGSAFNLDSSLVPGSSNPRNSWLNYGSQYQALGRQFDYDWNNDYKTMLKGAGIASPIIQTLLRLLGGK